MSLKATVVRQRLSGKWKEAVHAEFMLQSLSPGLYLVFYQTTQRCRAEAHWLDTFSGGLIWTSESVVLFYAQLKLVWSWS